MRLRVGDLDHFLFQRHRIAGGIGLLVIGCIVVAGLLTIYPIVVDQVTTLSSTFDNKNLELIMKRIGESVSSVVPFLKADAVAAKLNALLPKIVQDAEGLMTNAITVVALVIIVPLISFFFLNDYYKMQKGFIAKIPNKYFEMALNVIHKLEMQLSNYIRGVCFESLIVGTMYMCAYFLIGIKYATVLGIVGGIMNVIPIVGPLIGAVPALLVSMFQHGDLSMLFPIIAVVFVVQQTDAMLIQPNIYGKVLNAHPLTIILVILIGSKLMGILGMVMAIPIYTVISVTARETNWGLKNYKITQ